MELQPICLGLKSNWKLSIIILLISLVSCTKNNDNSKLIIKSKKVDYTFDDFSFCIDEPYVYLKLTNENESKKLEKLEVEEFFIIKNDISLQALPQNILSSTLPKSKLIYLTQSNSKKLEFVLSNNKEKWFILKDLDLNNEEIALINRACLKTSFLSVYR